LNHQAAFEFIEERKRHLMKKYGLLLLAALTLTIPLLAGVVSAAPSFPDANFQKTWERTDKILTERTNVGRGYVWGPESIFNGLEPYTEASNGQRTVQYFDKARMEVNNPGADRNDPNFVTSGLLVKELVLGRQQNGNNVGNFIQGNPSEVQVAGDPNTGGLNAGSPTYRSFRNLATFNNDNPVDPKLGQGVFQRIDKSGTVSTITSPDSIVILTAYESSTRHNIANVFVSYGNTQGQIWNGSSYVNGALFSPSATYVFGLPISDPYWVRSVVSGTEKDVLVQLFERRVLTYTPTNDASNKVEMGNVGQHYYRWRYQENIGLGGGGTVTPTTPVTTSPTTTTTPTPVPATDYSQFRAPYLKSGSIPQGGTNNVTNYVTGAPAINSSPAYDSSNKLAIVSTSGGGVVAIDTNNFSSPSQRWKFQPSGANFTSPVTLFNNIVYVGATDGKIYAIKETDGSQIWATTSLGGAITSAIALDSDSLYFVSNDGKLYARELATGNAKWQGQPGGVNFVYSPIIGPDGTLYVAGNDNRVYAFKKDGSQIPTSTWNLTALDAGVSANLAFGNGRLYVVTTNGTLYALNNNGTIQTQKTFSVGKGIYTTPAIVSVNGTNRVYVGSDDGKGYGVLADDVTNVQWTFVPAGGPFLRSSFAIVDGFVYFGAEDKNIYKVEAANSANSAVLATATEKFGTNSAIVNSGMVLIPAQNGTLHLVR